MRILFFFHMPELNGGANRSGLSLVKGLKNNGHEIYAVCPAEGELSEELRKIGIPVKTVRFDWVLPCVRRDVIGAVKFIPAAVRNYFFNKKAYSELTEYAREISPDIIHSNTSVINIGFKIAKKLNLPHITHFRELGMSDCNALLPHKRKMMRYPYQYSVAIGMQVFEKHTLSDCNRNKIIYNGIVSAEDFRVNDSDKKYFLFVGGLYKSKGVEDLLEAYSRLPREMREAHPIKIAGSTVIKRYEDKLKSLAARLGIAADIEWLGQRNDVADLMYGAKALVVPSFHEAFGRIVVEAMCNGTVVIGRDTAGIKEQFDNGLKETGKEIGLRFSTVTQLADAMINVCDARGSELNDMIKRGQTTVGLFYTQQRYIDNMDQYYRSVVKDWIKNQ